MLCLTRPSPRRGRCETALPTSVGHHHIRATPRDRVVSAITTRTAGPVSQPGTGCATPTHPPTRTAVTATTALTMTNSAGPADSRA